MSLTQGYSGATGAVSIGGVTVQAAVQVDSLGNIVSPGGSATVAIAGATVSNTVVKASAGRLCRVLVQATVASNAILVYDNATTNTGTVIGAVPVGAAVGSYDFQIPAANGITVAGNATNPAMTISYY
jgi:hypothetical protein